MPDYPHPQDARLAGFNGNSLGFGLYCEYGQNYFD